MRGLSIQLHKTSCSNDLTIAPSLKIGNDCEYYINYICNISNHVSKGFQINRTSHDYGISKYSNELTNLTISQKLVIKYMSTASMLLMIG